MTDLLSIGASGINVYQRALSTVSNNIANLNTDGYSRQTTEIRQNQPTSVGNGFIGTGAYFDRVSRQYDSFLESSLQQATSDLESQGAAVEFANRLLDVLGDEKIGLTTALNKFFASAKALSTDPASPALRGVMLRESEALASRFNGLSTQLSDLGEQSLSAMEADVRSVNALVAQIAEVNGQMLKKSSSLDQAPELLDRRDQLLRDLSEYVQIRTTFDKRGSVTVSLTESATRGVIVSGSKFSNLAVAPVTGEPERLSYRLQGELTNEQLNGLASGSVSGFGRFYEDTLVRVQVSLDDLADVLIDEVNAVQTAGLDGTGVIGSDYFEIIPTFDIDRGASAGDFDVQVLVTEPSNYQAENLTVAYDGTRSLWYATDSNGAQTYANTDGLLQLEQLTIQVTGQARVGDQFTIVPDASAARGMRLSLTDGIEIAAASLFRATPASTNNGVFDPKVSFVAPDTKDGEALPLASLQTGRALAVTPSQTRPLTVVPAGQNSVSFTLGSNSGSDHALQIMTADGRHLIGSTEIGQPSTLLQTASQFTRHASYSDAYLNASGIAGYKDYDVFYGAQSEASAITQLLPASGLNFEAPFGTDFIGGGLDITVSPASSEEQLSLQNSAFADPSLGAVSAVDNALYLGQGASAVQIGTVEATYDGVAQTLRIQFTESTEVGAISDELTSRLASLVTYQNGSDLSRAGVDIRKQITATAFTEDRGVERTVTRDFSSRALVEAGQVSVTTPSFVATLESQGIEYAAGAGRTVIDAGDLTLNGVALGDLSVGETGVMSADDVKQWLDAADTDIEVRATNEIEIAASSLQLSESAGLSINATAVTSLVTGSSTRFEDDEDLVASINAVSNESGVFAQRLENGTLLLRNMDLGGANIAVGSGGSGLGSNALGIANKAYVGQISMSLETGSNESIQIEIGASGRPADLNMLGFATEVRVTGAIDEDLLVFMTGSGDGVLTAQSEVSDTPFAEGLRQRRFEFEFIAEDRYRVTDLTTNTVVADRNYFGEPSLNYQGMQVTLDRLPALGDTFVIDGNNLGPGGTFDAQGNNANILRFVDLEKKGVLDGGLTISEGYLSFVGDVGNMATQSEIARDALQIVQTQAFEARDRVSGVNLDKEAADLIRFQQAYQASAQVMQVATRLFDAMLQIR